MAVALLASLVTFGQPEPQPASRGLRNKSGCAAKANKLYGAALELWRADELIGSSLDQAEEILDAIGDIPASGS